MSKLRSLDEGLWTAEMPASKMGFEFGGRMTVVRLPDGGLWVHSPIALAPELQADLDAAGPVRVILSPSKLHYEHLPEFARAYPEARVLAPAELRERLKALSHLEPLPEKPDAVWSEALDQVPFQGSALYDETVFFHRSTRTLILTDLLFHIPETSNWSTRLWARMLGILGRAWRSRTFDLSARDRHAIGAGLERILAWDFDRIILSHGDIVPTGGRQAFRSAFEPYLK